MDLILGKLQIVLGWLREQGKQGRVFQFYVCQMLASLNYENIIIGVGRDHRPPQILTLPRQNYSQKY